MQILLEPHVVGGWLYGRLQYVVASHPRGTDDIETILGQEADSEITWEWANWGEVPPQEGGGISWSASLGLGQGVLVSPMFNLSLPCNAVSCLRFSLPLLHPARKIT